MNANFFYLEYLRLHKDYEKMAKVASGNLRRLKQAKAMLELDMKAIKPEIFEFIELGIKFYKAYGMSTLIRHYQKLIDREEYGKKNHSKMTFEMLCMAEQTHIICEEMRKMKPDKIGNLSSCLLFAEFIDEPCVK